MSAKDLKFFGAVVIALVIGTAAYACKSARQVPYVQTTGVDGYWNAHYVRGSRLLILASGQYAQLAADSSVCSKSARVEREGDDVTVRPDSTN